MNKKIYFLLIISVFLLISACSRKDGNAGADKQEVIIVDDLTADEKEKLFKSSAILFRENPYLADNLSRIETSRSEQGTKKERYFYNNMPNLKFIEVFTLANGQKQIFIHNENGTVKSLSEFSLSWLAKASPDEITGDAPTAAAEQPKESSSGIKINKLPPIVVNSSPLPTPNQPTEPQPKNEANTKTNPPNEKKDSKNETTSPTKNEK